MADHAGKVQAGDNVPSMYVRGFFFSPCRFLIILLSRSKQTFVHGKLTGNCGDSNLTPALGAKFASSSIRGT